MFEPLHKLLDVLERTIDVEQQRRSNELHRRALLYEPVERLPLNFLYPPPADGEFQPVPYPEAFASPEKMLYNQLIYAHGASIAYHDRIGDDLTYTIRPNCGVGVIASLFGAQIELTDDNLPWVRGVKAEDTYRALLDCDPTELTQGLVPKLIDIYNFYHDVLEGYPNLKQAVMIVLPDLQGPFDTAELLVGSSIFVDFYEKPDQLQSLLGNLARAQVAVAKHLLPLLTDGPAGFSHQHLVLVKGNILLRDDSPIMVSPEMYREHIAPHDEYILRELGGGGIHYCGKGDHLVDEFLALPSIQCLDLGQSYLNDLDAIYAKAMTKKIPIIRVWPGNKDELLDPALRERFPTGMNMNFTVDSLEEAQKLWREYISG